MKANCIGEKMTNLVNVNGRDDGVRRLDNGCGLGHLRWLGEKIQWGGVDVS